MNNAGEKAWAALIGNIIAWEYLAPPGHMFSHAYARLRNRHPILTRAAVLITLLHLEDVLPRTLDPFQIGLFAWARRLEHISAHSAGS